MDTFTGRRTTSGEWVAWGLVGELADACASQRVVEVYSPSRHVLRARITRVGHGWVTAGCRVAYGYLAPVEDEAVTA